MKKQTPYQVAGETGEIIESHMAPFVRTPWNYNREFVSRETGTTNEEPTLTQQHFKEECDINQILEKFNVTGAVPTNVRQPINQDFIEAIDYQTALNALMEAEASFMEMPAKVRAEFDNDPGKFVQFFEREENRERAVALGLIKGAPEAPKPPETPSTPGAE